MGRLSNFGRPARPQPPPNPPSQSAILSPTDAAPSQTVRVRPARPEELSSALRLALGSAGRPADDEHVVQFVNFAAGRGIDTTDVWLAERDAALLGGGVREKRGEAAPDSPTAALVEAVCAHFAARGVQLAQVLLDPADEPSRRLYEHHGFRRIAQLLYLQSAPRRRFAPPPLPDGFTWVPYAAPTHALFLSTIADTYQGSLDCPTLNGLRDMEDVVAGHKSSGEFDPGLWVMLCERGEPRGVLLLSPMPAAETMELVYLGLVPAARGRGMADLLVRQSLAAVTAAGLARLSLAVDADNLPALRLYYRHGLQRVASKLAMMRLLHGRWREG
jgi:mycothiol synthase